MTGRAWPLASTSTRATSTTGRRAAMPIDAGALARAGYVPCLYAGDDPAVPDLCTGRAWADDAEWVAPGLLWASYPAADCGHTAPWEFLITLTDADLAAADEHDRAVYGGDAP